MPRIPTVDASAGVRSAQRRLVGLEHLVLTLVLLALYAVAMSVALDHGTLRACGGTSAGTEAGSSAGTDAGTSAGTGGTSCTGHARP